jgi:hypothetical protein
MKRRGIDPCGHATVSTANAFRDASSADANQPSGAGRNRDFTYNVLVLLPAYFGKYSCSGGE